MKTLTAMLTVLGAGAFLQACDSAETRYLDLNTGQRVELQKDAKTGYMVNAETGEPVEIYVDRTTKDTLYGRTGKVINGKVRKADDDRWVYILENEDNNAAKRYDGDDDTKVKRTDDEYKIKNGDYKKEVEKDGDVIIKNGDTKIKIDGETGERKVKRDD